MSDVTRRIERWQKKHSPAQAKATLDTAPDTKSPALLGLLISSTSMRRAPTLPARPSSCDGRASFPLALRGR